MKRLIMALLMSTLLLSSCVNNKNNKDNQSEDDITDNIPEEEIMKLEIDENVLDVSWNNSASVTALKEIKPLTINMHLYGGFEQVGSIGQSIVSDDKEITTKPGDIVLYSNNQIVVFFGTNTWSYTKLGHINLSDSELNTLLNKSNVTLKIY